MSDTLKIVFLGLMIGALCGLVLASTSQSNTSPSTTCDTGKVVIYEDGSAACIINIKGAE